MGFKMFPWVPDGIYDNTRLLVRYQVVAGLPKKVIAKAWVDQGGPDDVDAALRSAWGTFPDMPAKN